MFFYIDLNMKLFSCRYCESRCKVLLDHVHEGYERDLWDHQENL